MSALATSHTISFRHLRPGSEAELARGISRVTASALDFATMLQRIGELALVTPGVSRLEVLPAEPLLPLVSERVIFGGQTSNKGRGSAVADLRADGKNWGELRVYFELQQSPIESPVRLAKFVAQQIALAAVLADLRNRRESLQQEASYLQIAVAKRKAIHRATALVCHAHNLHEEDGFLLLRKYSYDSGRTLHEIADAVVLNERQKTRTRKAARFPVQAPFRNRTASRKAR